MEVFAERLKKARKARDLTQRQLADLTKMDQGHISRLESGGKSISIEHLYEIARALGTTVSYLIGENIKEERSAYNATTTSSTTYAADTPLGLRELANDKQLTAALNISKAEWKALNSIETMNDISKDGYVQLLITIRAVSGTR